MMTIESLKTPTLMRDYAFDRVTVNGRRDGESESRPLFSIVGVCWSEYRSGPGLLGLADVAGAALGPGFYGLELCRFLGWRHGRVSA